MTQYKIVLPLAAVLACSCADLPRDDRDASVGRDLGDWVFTSDRIGDTVVIRTVAGSVWDSVELVTELTVGQLHGPDDYTFGSISAVSPGPDGSIYVMDSHARQIRQYSADGKHRRDIGREGGGPGEYKYVLELVTTTDGTLIAWDIGNARLNRYNADGTVLDSWLVGGSATDFNNLFVDRYDHVYVWVTLRETKDEYEALRTGYTTGYAHYDPTGSLIDTVAAPPNPPFLGRFGPRQWAVIHPSGHMIVGTSDRYSLDLASSDTVLRIERAVGPVQFTAGEREQWNAAMACQRSMTPGGFAWREPSTPETKPFYRELRVGSQGRIWVRLYTQAEEIDTEAETPQSLYSCIPVFRWREPRPVYDIFESDGSYLGQIQFPERSRVMAMRGDWAWGVQLGEYDEEYLVRWRLQH